MLGSEAYTYDPAGNRFPGDPGLASQWTYREYRDNNELRTTDAASYDYDAAGNLTRRTGPGGEMRFFYDEQSRLMRVESGTGDVVAQYGYDPFGRRLWKEAGGNRTYFSYTGEGLAAELDASGNPVRTYGWTPKSGWMAAPVFVHDASGYAYYQNDHLGTPQKLTDATGHVVWSALYSSFGVAQPQVETVVNPLRFPGQYFDAETGLHQNFFRDYDAQLGRYIEPDPLRSTIAVLDWTRAINGRFFHEPDGSALEGTYSFLGTRGVRVTGRLTSRVPPGLITGMSWYAYAGDNPLKLIDPFGLSTLDYDAATGTLTLYDNSGNRVAQYPAGNNVTSGSNGPWPPGTYTYSYHVPHSESGPSGPYGSQGNFVFDVPGRTGMGVHSGRQGPQSLTNGCIRTTDEGTAAISGLNATDPLTSIRVR